MEQTTTRSTVRLTTVLVAMLTTLALAFAMPGVASADSPEEGPPQVVVQEDVPHPCHPSQTHTHTIVFTARSHEHTNNSVRWHAAEFSTDDGFVGKGQQTDVFVGGVRRTVVNLMAHNPDTGERFTVKVRFVLDSETGQFIRPPEPTLNCMGTPN